MSNDPTGSQKRRLRAHFGFTKIPFTKYMWAKHMFDSQSQRELLHGLTMWTEVGGIALVSGPSGVGKSITLRRFVHDLDENRFRIFEFSTIPSTVFGFLRSFNRILGLPMRNHASDLFHAAQKHLMGFGQEQGPHPIVLLDDAEGLRAPVIDLMRRFTSYDLDAEDRFSILLSGTEHLLPLLRDASLESLRSRIAYAHALRPFSLEDTRNYVRFHIERSGADPKLFTDDAVRQVFQASQGRPRSINQLAIQALINAAVQGRDTIDGAFMAPVITAHPLYQQPQGGSG